MLNPLNFISKFIKSSNQRELERLNKIVKKVNSLETFFEKLDDNEFPKKTLELKNRLIYLEILVRWSYVQWNLTLKA